MGREAASKLDALLKKSTLIAHDIRKSAKDRQGKVRAIMVVRKTTNGTLRQLTAKEGRELLDRQARRYLKISGEEFMRRSRGG